MTIQRCLTRWSYNYILTLIRCVSIDHTMPTNKNSVYYLTIRQPWNLKTRYMKITSHNSLQPENYCVSVDRCCRLQCWMISTYADEICRYSHNNSWKETIVWLDNHTTVFIGKHVVWFSADIIYSWREAARHVSASVDNICRESHNNIL